MTLFTDVRFSEERNVDISVKMKRDWNRRAKVDSTYFVAATEEADASSYAETARNDLSAFLGGLGDRVPRESRVLDLGCGVGRMTAPLAEHFRELVGVDVSDEMIHEARQQHRNIDNLSFMTNNGLDLSEFVDESFELVFSYSVLPHLPPQVVSSYLSEVNRVLKPGAWFRFQFWLGTSRKPANNDTLNIRVYEAQEFDGLMADGGFELHEIEEIDYLDPILNIKPVWVNVRKQKRAIITADYNLSCEMDDSREEKALETSLLIYLAKKHQERGKLKEAEFVIRQAVNRQADNVDAYVAWSSITLDQGDPLRALEILEALTLAVPESAQAWLFRAQAESGLQRPESALESIYKARSLTEDPEILEVVNRLKLKLNDVNIPRIDKK